MHIIELLKNVASCYKFVHRFGISATNLVNYFVIEHLFKALLNISSIVFKFVVYRYIVYMNIEFRNFNFSIQFFNIIQKF